MNGITFAVSTARCGCCSEESICADGVHLKREVKSGDGCYHFTWRVVGECDGSCQQELPRQVINLIRDFKASGKIGEWSERSDQADIDAQREAKLEELNQAQEQLELAR